jgi:glycosyltransferase involved in cell wall biosynthesis
MNNFIYLIPLHNKSGVIEQTVTLLKHKFQNPDISGQFIFIENGSTDDSLKKILSITKDDPRFIILSSEKGFGEALKIGMIFVDSNIHKKNTMVVITGADLPFQFTDIDNYLNEYHIHNSDIYIGSKSHKLSNIKRSFSRRFISKIFNILLRLLFGVKLMDTQGTFLIDASKVEISKIIPDSKNFFSTAEICIRSVNLGHTITEIPITHIDTPTDTSTVKIFSDTVKIIKDMILLKKQF